MLSSQEEQIERRRVFAEDQSLPRQATTMHAFAQADAAMPRGRFSAVEAATVVGSNPTIDYPAGPAWSADPGSQCVEPPLGEDNPALEPSSCEAQATGPTSDAPTPLGQRDVGSFSSDDPTTTEGPAPPSASPRGARGLVVGSSPFRRRA
jgi:hypothetical protein